LIALFGGSFNPIHNGHIKAAKLVLKHCRCKKLWFIPCYKHAFKPELERFEHRSKMIELAIGNEKRFKLCLIEKRLAKRSNRPNTTLETVLALKKAHPKEKFFWVIGSNLLNELPKWYKFSKLVEEIRFVVVPIKGFKMNKRILTKLDATVIDEQVDSISSSRIRNIIKSGAPPKRFLPQAVWRYIEENLLYTSDFARKVYALTRLVPKGKVTTYKDIAKALCSGYRAVGNALNKNCFSTVPCHRVVKSDGTIGGFSRGSSKKAELLRREGLTIEGNRIVDFEQRRISHKKLILLKKRATKS
jgi:nicotinate-nucleotide adenylyltransferase